MKLTSIFTAAAIFAASAAHAGSFKTNPDCATPLAQFKAKIGACFHGSVEPNTPLAEVLEDARISLAFLRDQNVGLIDQNVSLSEPIPGDVNLSLGSAFIVATN